MKWKRLNKKQPKKGQKVIWRSFKDNSIYKIYYGTYLGISETYPNSQYYMHIFKMWFNSNLTLYNIKTNDVIWIPYPTGED